MDIPTLAAEVTGALVPALPRHHQATVQGDGAVSTTSINSGAGSCAKCFSVPPPAT